LATLAMMEIYRCAGEGRAKLNTVANRHGYVSKWAWLLQGSPAIFRCDTRRRREIWHCNNAPRL